MSTPFAGAVAFALAASLSPTVMAQVAAEPVAPLASAPHGISVASGTGSSTGGALPAGFPVSIPAGAQGGAAEFAPATGGLPDFSSAAMWVLASLDVDAMSIGEAYINLQILSDGRPVIPDPPGVPAWGFLTMSVVRGGVFKDAVPAQLPDNGADLFGYFYPGSTAVPGGTADVIVLSNEDEELGIDPQGEIDALDLNMAYYTAPGSDVVGAVLSTAPTFYFSLTSASAQISPPAWWGMDVPSGAAILKMEWTPSPGGGGSWAGPSVFRSAADLGLSASAELDALSVDAAQQRLVFSTAGAPVDEQLMVYLYGAQPGSGPPVPYEFRIRGPVGRVLAPGMTNTDDIDAICILDPEEDPLQGQPYDSVTRLVGFPVRSSLRSVFPGAPTIQASCFRVQAGPSDPNSVDALSVHARMWPQFTGSGIAAIVFFRSSNLPFMPLPFEPPMSWPAKTSALPMRVGGLLMPIRNSPLRSQTLYLAVAAMDGLGQVGISELLYFNY